jgi:uncharacterized integral membrane protein
MNQLKVVAIAVLAVVVVIVVLQNTQAVETKLLFLTLTLPNAVLLFGTLIVGFTIGVLTAGHIVSLAKRRRPEELTSEGGWSSSQRR